MFSQLFRWKNINDIGLPVSLESFPENRGQKLGYFPSNVFKLLMPRQ